MSRDWQYTKIITTHSLEIEFYFKSANEILVTWGKEIGKKCCLAMWKEKGKNLNRGTIVEMFNVTFIAFTNILISYTSNDYYIF